MKYTDVPEHARGRRLLTNRSVSVERRIFRGYGEDEAAVEYRAYFNNAPSLRGRGSTPEEAIVGLADLVEIFAGVDTLVSAPPRERPYRLMEQH